MPAQTTGSKDLDALVARFKKGYELEKTRNHYRVRDPQGNLVELNGKNLTLTGTAHGGSATANMTAELKSAGVLSARSNGAAPKRKTPKQIAAEKKRMDAFRASTAERSKKAQQVADQLYERLEPLLKNVGGMSMPGMVADLGWILAMIAREQGETSITPDLTTASAFRVTKRHPVSPKYAGLWDELATRLETAEDPVEAFFELVRAARGLPSSTIVEQERFGATAEGDWPFKVEQLPVEAFIVDHDYQRPVSWPFVRSHAARFDETLVGTIDVAERRRGAVYAILDGQSRYEMCRLVGKTTIWASIYSGFDKPSEARFFLHKNKDKKAIHPYHTFRAKLAANDADATAINQLCSSNGYKITGWAANEKNPDQISAISALEEVYRRKGEDGENCLEPTLATLKASTFGLRSGQSAILLRALGIVHQRFGHKLEEERLRTALRQTSPELLLTRAREFARQGSKSLALAMAKTIVGDYNRGLGRGGEKLGTL